MTLTNEYSKSQDNFPDVKRMQKLLISDDFAKFEDLDKEIIKVLYDRTD